MRNYLAPIAVVEGQVSQHKTPKEFRERFEKPENKDTLPFVFVDVPAVSPSTIPAGIDLGNGFKYVLFYGPINHLHASTEWSPSERAPSGSEWIYAQVRFGDNHGEWGYWEAIGDDWTGLYYVGGNAPTTDEVIHANNQLKREG